MLNGVITIVFIIRCKPVIHGKCRIVFLFQFFHREVRRKLTLRRHPVLHLGDSLRQIALGEHLPIRQHHHALKGVAEFTDIPLPGGSADLLISRGSVPFWTDHVAAFKELSRVLAPSGAGLVGCGFSRYQPIEEVRAMRPKWSGDGEKDTRNDWKKPGYLPQVLAKAGADGADVKADSYGIWVRLGKMAGVA